MDKVLQRYRYNFIRRNIALEDSSENRFCRYFNGLDTKGDIVTYGDYFTKKGILSAIENCTSIYSRNHQPLPEICTLEFQWLNPIVSEVRLDNNDKKYRYYVKVTNPKEYISGAEGTKTPYSYHRDAEYNQENNSITIIPGRKFYIGDKIYLVGTSKVHLVDIGGNELKGIDRNAWFNMKTIDLLIRCANDQLPFSSFSETEKPFLNRLLNKMGLDISRNIVINEREIKLVGGMPIAVDMLEDPLGGRYTKNQRKKILEKYAARLLLPYESN